jgi:ABC-2 type transport system permease protein
MTLAIVAGTAIALFGVLGPVFDLPMRGSLPAFFLITALYVFTTAGLACWPPRCRATWPRWAC